MKQKNWIWIILALVVVAGGAYWYQNQNKTKQDDVIKIGAILPLTGEVATYGQSLKKGFDIAIEEEKGRFKIIYEDSKADKKAAVGAINKLISQDKVKFFLGDATSGVTLTIAPIIEKNKCILMVPIATSDDIKNAGDYIFRNAPRNEKQAYKVAEIFKEKKPNHPAIIYRQDDYGVNMNEKFDLFLTPELKAKLITVSYQDGTTDFRNVLAKMKDQKPDAIFIPGRYEDAARILKQLNDYGLQNVYKIGTDGAYSDEIMKIAGKTAEGFEFTMMGVNKENIFYKNFLTLYQTKYPNQTPDIFTCYGYESAKILIEAIKKGNYEPDKVKVVLYSSTFESLTGNIKFDNDGEVTNRDYLITKIINNKFQ